MSQTVSADRKPDLLMCILSYFNILALIPYLTRKDDEFIQWHAKQGLVLAAVMIALMVVLSILSMLPLIGFIAAKVFTLVGLASLALSIYCIVQAYSGKQWRIPGIGNIVR